MRTSLVMKWCCMCKTCRESINCLFFHCEVVTEMWSALLQLFGVVWVMPQRVSGLLISWRGQLGNRMALHLWRMASLCLMWCLWWEQNACSFDDCKNGLLDLKKSVLQTLYTWRVAWNTICFYFFLNF
jgi:hypothetical protein